MNDVLDPLRVRRELGGRGFDYHHVLEDPLWWRGFLINETGFGRLALNLRFRDFNHAAGRAALSVENMVIGVREVDRRTMRAWRRMLSDLEELYAIAEEAGVRPLLLIFPYDFQLGEPTLQQPQEQLVRHARRNRVRPLDLTRVFEEWKAEGWSSRDLFLDGNHLTAAAHQRLASRLRRLVVNTEEWSSQRRGGKGG